MAAASASLEVLSDPRRVAAAIPPLRRQLLSLLTEADSASGLARKLDLPRQKVNYHLRELERVGLVELVEERSRRGLTERRVRVTARAWVVDPSLLAAHGFDADELQDQFSSAYLVSTAARLIGDVATLRERSKLAKRRLATVTMETQIAFGAPRDLRAFVHDLHVCLADLTAKYQRAGGRPYRVVLAAHPRIQAA